jgi:hypothetical protein
VQYAIHQAHTTVVSIVFFASAENGQFELSPGISYGPFQGKTSDGILKFPEINQQAAQLDGIAKFILENKRCRTT